jgi:ABC-type glycerol-3-phosphate transport system permease component
MAVVTSKGHKVWNRALVALVFLVLLIYLLPLYWISSTAFKPRSLATTVPPTVLFEPELTPFVKLFTSRVQMRGARSTTRRRGTKSGSTMRASASSRTRTATWKVRVT